MNDQLACAAAPTHARHIVSAWLAAAAAIAYVCRNSIVVAEKTIRLDLGLTEAQMGFILGPAFFWTYALAQIPTGWFGERFGSRRCLPVLSISWSIATACFGLARGLLMLVVGRAAMGLAQAGLFPCSANTISLWHPQTERAFASGLLGAFMSVGGAVGAVYTALLLDYLDWQWIFLAYGLSGVFWAAGFLIWFRDLPVQHAGVNEHELTLINTGKRPPADDTRSPAPSFPWRALVTSPAMWLISGQQFFRAAGYIFFGSWFATYLQETRDVTTSQSGVLLVGPLLGTVLASLLGGGLSDWLFRRTRKLDLARKTLASCSLAACALLVFAAYFVADARLAVAVISLGSFCAGFAGPCAYAVTMDMGGRHVAAVFATMNMVGNFGAGLLPWVVPRFRHLVERNEAALSLFGGNSWDAVLVLFGAMYVVAAICWLLLRTEGSVFDQAARPTTRGTSDNGHR